jgi:hypothetical protein
MRIEWSRWTPIGTPSGHSGPAVYAIRALVGDEPLEIGRFLKHDVHGIVSLGKTANFEARMVQFRAALAGNGAHAEASLLRLLATFTPLSDRAASLRCHYKYAPLPSEDDALGLECMFIKAYVIEYGEPPLLNRVIPYRYDETTWQSARLLMASGAIQQLADADPVGWDFRED